MSEKQKFEKWSLDNNMCGADDLLINDHGRHSNYMMHCCYLAWLARAQMDSAVTQSPSSNKKQQG
jgi:hypothetical protein